MTTLHLTNAYHATSGGIRTFYTALLEAGNAAGRRVVVVVPGRGDEVEDVGPFGRIYHVKAVRAPAFDRRYRLLLPHQYAPFCGSRIARILERERPGLVEICDKYSLPYLAAMLRKRWHRRIPRPVLVGLSCERFDDNMAAYLSGSRAARAFTQWYIRHVYGPPFDAHIAISEYTAGELRSALWDRAPGFITTRSMGVDADGFGPERRSEQMRRRLLERAGGTPASVLLLYAGRLSPEKNVPLLVEMLRFLVAQGDRDYRLVLAGDGPCAAWLRAQAQGPLEGRIAFCGALDRETLAAGYASADVFVHPNSREPFGIGPLEAMASGVPVVVPNRGGVLTYASVQNAWLAAPTGAAFAAAVNAALAGDGERVRQARATARRFHWSRVTQRYFALYDRLCRRSAADAATGDMVTANPGGATASAPSPG